MRFYAILFFMIFSSHASEEYWGEIQMHPNHLIELTCPKNKFITEIEVKLKNDSNDAHIKSINSIVCCGKNKVECEGKNVPIPGEGTRKQITCKNFVTSIKSRISPILRSISDLSVQCGTSEKIIENDVPEYCSEKKPCMVLPGTQEKELSCGKNHLISGIRALSINRDFINAIQIQCEKI